MWGASVTSALVDITTQDNATWQDAWQFWPIGGCYNGWWGSGGPYAPVTNPGQYTPGCTGTTGPFSAWNFNGESFRLDIKANKWATAALLSLTSAAGQIIIQDPINRILQMNVPESVFTGVVVPGSYPYELMMFNSANPSIRTPLMHGKFTLTHGVAGG
jgi:hypothetical protein